jgi:hypothetical protein
LAEEDLQFGEPGKRHVPDVLVGEQRARDDSLDRGEEGDLREQDAEVAADDHQDPAAAEGVRDRP